MAAHTINIEVKQNADGSYYLYLTDDENHQGVNNIKTDAQPGDTLTWNISTHLPDTTVSISNVYEKPGTSVDVFDSTGGSEPHSNGNGTWSGTVNTNITSEEVESYNIDYYVNGVKHTDDPQIDVTPRP